MTSYADDTTPYVTGDNLESAIKQLDQAGKVLFR